MALSTNLSLVVALTCQATQQHLEQNGHYFSQHLRSVSHDDLPHVERCLPHHQRRVKPTHVETRQDTIAALIAQDCQDGSLRVLSTKVIVFTGTFRCHFTTDACNHNNSLVSFHHWRLQQPQNSHKNWNIFNQVAVKSSDHCCSSSTQLTSALWPLLINSIHTNTLMTYRTFKSNTGPITELRSRF